MMKKTDPSQLSGTELTYEFLKSREINILGDRAGPFAISDRTTKKLYIFGGDASNVIHISFEDDPALHPLEIAQKLRANFSVVGEIVTCSIGDTIASGKNYFEAAMRALITNKVTTTLKD